MTGDVIEKILVMGRGAKIKKNWKKGKKNCMGSGISSNKLEGKE